MTSPNQQQHPGPRRTISTKSTRSPQRQTADTLVAAFNTKDIDTILTLLTPTSTRHITPSTLNIAAQDKIQYRTHLEQLRPSSTTSRSPCTDVLEDREAGRVCMWLAARSDTLADKDVDEDMWMLEFDGSGERVAKSTELVDALVNREVWPKLREARREAEAQTTSSSA